MNMNLIASLFAHAGEDHDTVIDTAAHSAPEWYIAIPLFLIVIALVANFIWTITKKNLGTTILVTAIILLMAGFTMYRISPAISVISLTAGFILAGFLALGSISGKPQ